MGSSGSVASVRSSGSGQSAGSGQHVLHPQAEGVKLLATVLSQSAKAKEHLLEQSKSVDQPAGSASSSRTSSQSGCPLHEAPPYDVATTRKGEGQGEGKVGQSRSLTAVSVLSPSFIQRSRILIPLWRDENVAPQSPKPHPSLSPPHTYTHTHTQTIYIYTHQDVTAVSLATGLVCAASVRMQP
ncbi:hypothetical protein EYF80_028136 [Liparis tanakae]|uniref:Caskin-1 CASK-interaction domain-containing protein n=1 Tax=Liparis tanakae TaxID=230148 RepID=A0A4Z2H7L6_9TELE|nr:hypothetical protein EYF80_028136 [Liparis tanakae]